MLEQKEIDKVLKLRIKEKSFIAKQRVFLAQPKASLFSKLRYKKTRI
jgi:hypothetical protein